MARNSYRSRAGNPILRSQRGRDLIDLMYMIVIDKVRDHFGFPWVFKTDDSPSYPCNRDVERLIEWGFVTRITGGHYGLSVDGREALIGACGGLRYNVNLRALIAKVDALSII